MTAPDEAQLSERVKATGLNRERRKSIDKSMGKLGAEALDAAIISNMMADRAEKSNFGDELSGKDESPTKARSPSIAKQLTKSGTAFADSNMDLKQDGSLAKKKKSRGCSIL